MRGGRVEAFIGRFGAGKTYSMVCNAWREHQQSGIPIACNFELLGDGWGEWVPYRTWQELVQLEGCLVLMDEAGLWFNNRNYRDFPPEVAAWVTQMRHLDCWYWYTVQHEASVDANLRRNTSTYWSHQRFGPWILQRGYEPLEKEQTKFQTKWHRLKPSMFARYDTKEVIGNAKGEGTRIGGRRLRPSKEDAQLVREAKRSITRVEECFNRIRYRRSVASDIVDGLPVYPVRSNYDTVVDG